MINLNDDSIIVGEIKQLLHNFNLPNCVVCKTDEEIAAVYSGTYYIDIRNSSIYYKDSDGVSNYVRTYKFGEKITNLVSNLPINNMIYDIQTHNYLGKFLRFIRDYSGIDLMSMYNCWGGQINDLDVESAEGADFKFDFNTTADDYVIYKVPVSLCGLTISLHNIATAEMCLALDVDSAGVEEVNDNWLAPLTFARVRMNDYCYYDKYLKVVEKPTTEKQILYWEALHKYIDKLCLLIKVPKQLNSSIVVLEGKYYPKAPGTEYWRYIVDETGYTLSYEESGFKIASQLLSHVNSTRNYLLADRLVEYITGNAITNDSEDYDIKSAQLTLNKLKDKDGNYYITTELLSKFGADRYYGNWTDIDKKVLRQVAYDKGLFKKYDTQGYLDKDVEQKIQDTFDTYVGK